MKANEAPEKLYLHPTAKGKIGASWLTFPLTNEDIEYTRTDAFMKKAENFLEMLGYGFTITDNITYKNYEKEQLIEDFRNYIKGE